MTMQKTLPEKPLIPITEKNRQTNWYALGDYDNRLRLYKQMLEYERYGTPAILYQSVVTKRFAIYREGRELEGDKDKE